MVIGNAPPTGMVTFSAQVARALAGDLDSVAYQDHIVVRPAKVHQARRRDRGKLDIRVLHHRCDGVVQTTRLQGIQQEQQVVVLDHRRRLPVPLQEVAWILDPERRDLL